MREGARRLADLPWGVCRRQGRAGRRRRGGNVSPTPSLGVRRAGTGIQGELVTQGEVGGSIRATGTPVGELFPPRQEGTPPGSSGTDKAGVAKRWSLSRAGGRQAGPGRRVPAGRTVSPTSGAGGSGMRGRSQGLRIGRVDGLPQASSAPACGPAGGEAGRRRGAGLRAALAASWQARCQGITVGDTRPDRVTAVARARGHVSPIRRAGCAAIRRRRPTGLGEPFPLRRGEYCAWGRERRRGAGM